MTEIGGNRFVDEFGKVFDVATISEISVDKDEDEPEKFAVYVSTNNPVGRHQITRAFDDEEFANEIETAILSALGFVDVGSLVESAMTE